MTFGIPKLDLTCLKRTRPFLSTHRAQISHLSDRSSHILHSQGVEEGVSNQKRERQTLTSPQKLKASRPWAVDPYFIAMQQLRAKHKLDCSVT